MSTRSRRGTRANNATTKDGDNQISALQTVNSPIGKKSQTGTTTQSTERERVTYIAKEPTPNHTFLQPSGCTNLLNQKIAAIERCRGCYEKKRGASGCTFIGIRAFRVENREKDKTSKDEEATEDKGTIVNDTMNAEGTSLENGTIPSTPEQKKRKAIDDVSEPSPSKKLQKLKKGNSRSVSYEGVVWDDYSFIGNLDIYNPNGTGINNDIKDEDDDLAVAKRNNTSTPSKSEKEDASYILSRIAPSYLRVLKRERMHEKQLERITDVSKTGFKHPTVRMKPDPGQRVLCDACAASIFLVNYFCCVCGKEYCPDCYDEWDPDVECLRLDLCTRRRRHGKEQMMLMVRAAEGDLDSMLEPVQKWVDDHPACLSTGSEEQTVSGSKFTVDSSHGDGYLPVPHAHVDQLDEDDFRRLWSSGGRPLVLNGCLPHFKMQWTPAFFQEQYGDEKCYLHDCSDINGLYDATVKDFFDGFEKAVFQGKHLSLKLKDWPPSDDFAITFPELFRDFEGALPWEGRYMKRDGYMNVASRLPNDWNKPDLGPKMYNAYPAPGEGLSAHKDDAEEGNVVLGSGALGGTTNLHLDITDAVNFMMYASGPVPKLKPSDSDNTADTVGTIECSAVWDIFPPPAALQIRKYLSAKNPLIDDPIHRQTFFLSDDDLSNLREEPYNVRSYRIFQNPGDAVIIPAGCPHQVRNVRSCIKVAVDFLSPENVHVCEGLLQEGRNLAKSGRGGLPIEGTARITSVNEGKREDVLQLWNCIKFAWESLYDVTNSGDPDVLPVETSSDNTSNGITGQITNVGKTEKEVVTVLGVSDVDQLTSTKD